MGKIKIFIAAAEASPLAKVGGLADVIGSLPKTLSKLGVQITILLPKYKTIDEKKFKLIKTKETVKVAFGGNTETLPLWRTTLPDSKVPIILFEHKSWISRGGIYATPSAEPSGHESELQRFGVFSSAIAEYASKNGDSSTILHCNDWHVALAIPIMRGLLRNKKVHALITIHNLAYQGIYSEKIALKILGKDIFSIIPKQAKNKGNINLFASGILASNWTSTVSPTYREEILKPENGAGLDWALRAKKNKFVGILNGIDYKSWPPQKRFKTEKAFLCGMVSRIAEQKGFDILLPAMLDVLNKDERIKFTILGVGEPLYVAKLKKYTKQFAGRVTFINRFDEAAAQKIYANSDAFLIPSRFEPSGLGQMISMRYGTLPIARATGGLKDTINNLEDGFLFGPYSRQALADCILRAAKLFFNNPKKWNAMRKNAARKDFSWKKSALEYKKLFSEILQHKN